MGDKLARQRQFIGPRQPVTACIIEQQQFVVVTAERVLGAVDDQQRQLFALTFGLAIFEQIIGFRCKADTEWRIWTTRDFLENIFIG